MSTLAWSLLGVLGFVVGYGVGVMHAVVVRERRAAARRDRAVRHH